MLVPESGDSIQTLKAGVMEIADIFVVNKADRPGADRLRNEIELMLGLRQGTTLRERAGAPRRRPQANQRIRARDRLREASANAEPPNVDAAGAARRCGQGRGNRRDRGRARPALPLS